MSAAAVRGAVAARAECATTVDQKLGAIVSPVARATQSSANFGWRLEAGFDNSVRFTAPGSRCPVRLGTNISSTARGFYRILFVIEAARKGLHVCGAEVRGVFHTGSPGAHFQPNGANGPIDSQAPGHIRAFGRHDDNRPDWHSAYLAAKHRTPGVRDAAEI